VAEIFGKPVAVSARTGGGIGAAPCGYYQQPALIAASHASHQKTFFISGYRLVRLVALDFYLQFPALHCQDIQHIPGTHGLWKHFSPFFQDHAKPQTLKE